MNRRTLLALLAVYVIWGSTYLAIKYMVTGFPPLVGTGARFLVAGGVMYAVSVRRTGGLTRSQWWRATQLGALLLFGGTGLVTAAEASGVGTGVAAIAVSAMPLWAALLGGLFGFQPSLREWIGIAVGLIGVVLLGWNGDLSTNIAGGVLILVAPILWAIGSLRRRQIDFPSGATGVAAEMLAGGTLLVVFGLLRGERMSEVPSMAAWLAWGYLIVFGSLIAFSAYMYLLDTVRPTIATSYAFVNPVVAVLLAVTLGAEVVTLQTLGALTLVLSGVAIMMGLNNGVWVAVRRRLGPLRPRVA